jgi:hypothetical protein
VKSLIFGWVALCLMFMVQGCKQNMDLQPDNYFNGDQLTLARAIENGDGDEVKKLASKTDLNKPGKEDMTLLFWAVMNSLNDKKTPEHLKIITQGFKLGQIPRKRGPQGKISQQKY